MNYKDFNLGDWIGHISGAIEDERELDGNEMRDLVEFLSTLEQEPCEDVISRQAVYGRIRKEKRRMIYILPALAVRIRKIKYRRKCEDFLRSGYDIVIKFKWLRRMIWKEITIR